jgi:membrane protease YdiL (CAAX protease family)
MILIELLAHLPWPVWLGVAMLMAAVGLWALALERSRRKTYNSILTTVSNDTLLMDWSRRGRTLLVVRVYKNRRPDEVKRDHSAS